MKTKKLNINLSTFMGRDELNFDNKIEEAANLSLKKLNTVPAALLEESTIDSSNRKEGHNPDLIFDMHTKATKKLFVEESKKIVSTENYNSDKLSRKFNSDYAYFKTLEENLILDSSKRTFNYLLESVLIDTADLYKETNVTPRMFSLAVGETITEAENLEIYKNDLKACLEENFRLPLLQGTLLEENAPEVKKIIRISIGKGLDDLGEIHPDELGTTLGFNNVIKDHLSNVLLPENAMNKINAFANTQDDSYENLPGNAISILEKISGKLDKMVSLLSSGLFKDKVDLGEDQFDTGKYSAVSEICNASSEDPTGSCSVETTNSDDKPTEGDTDISGSSISTDELSDGIDLHDGEDLAKKEIQSTPDSVDKDLDEDVKDLVKDDEFADEVDELENKADKTINENYHV